MEPKMWTTDTGNGNNLSRASTVTFTPRPNSSGNPYLVGVQSRFRRKYFHKIIFLILVLIIIGLIIGIIVIACYSKESEHICESKECIRAASNLLETMNLKANPCNDFYLFSCGNWAEEHPRPDSSASYDWFTERQRRVLRNVREYLALNTTNDELPLPVKQSKIMYKACMDIEKMDALGLKPVTKYLKQYSLPEIPTYFNLSEVNYDTYNFDWISTIVKIKKSLGADLLVGFDVFPDPTNRTVNRVAMGTPESGTELPFNSDIDEKLNKMKKRVLTDIESVEDDDDTTLMAYVTYISEIMAAMVLHSNPTIKVEMYADDILKSAKNVVQTAKLIYKLTQEAENSTEMDKSNSLADIQNIYSYELQNMTDSYISPKKPIKIFDKYLTLVFENLTGTNFNLKTDKILTSNADIKYLQMLTEYLTNTTLAQIELYIWWTVVEELILHTTSTIRELHYEYSRSVTNLEGSVSRSLYCTGGVNQLMGMAVSYSIVDPNFLNITKPKVETMLKNIRISFNELVKTRQWMDTQTKKSTLEKSDNMKSFIGFPEWILNKTELESFYHGVEMNSSTHLDNMIGLLTWQMSTTLKKLHKTNEIDWATSPTNVNAFHTFQANTITIPLAILQYPFYHLGLEALNYGAIGTVLGHELTHGFDDSGRQFDKDGNMRPWWTNNTIEEYVNRTSCFVSQYAKYYLPEIKEFINGELTLGENIADNGGLREAYYAYKKYVKDNGKEEKLPGLEKFTHEQLFFISFGNLWCESATIQATKWAIEDSHCPGRIRLKGVLQNSPEFSSAFSCKIGSGMFPSNDRCRIW